MSDPLTGSRPDGRTLGNAPAAPSSPLASEPPRWSLAAAIRQALGMPGRLALTTYCAPASYRTRRKGMAAALGKYRTRPCVTLVRPH